MSANIALVAAAFGLRPPVVAALAQLLLGAVDVTDRAPTDCIRFVTPAGAAVPDAPRSLAPVAGETVLDLARRA